MSYADLKPKPPPVRVRDAGHWSGWFAMVTIILYGVIMIGIMIWSCVQYHNG